MAEATISPSPRGSDSDLGRPGREPAEPDPTAGRGGLAISEDWAATIVGLVLLGLALAGVITRAMIP